MPLLAGTLYDPAAAVSEATSSLLAMTAIDTTNLRLTFTVPPNGAVLVRMRAVTIGATTFPRILLGVLEGATVKLRMSPMGKSPTNLATTQMQQEIVGVVSGLTPGASLTWDAAYGVEILLAATNLKYGGPDDAAGADAFGGFVFEVWDTQALLAAKTYDPAAAATLAATSLLAMTAIDTTNLRNTIVAPASGRVMWRIHTQSHGSTTFGQILLGVLEGASVVGRAAPIMGNPQTNVATSCNALEASGVITGLTPGSSHTYDAAYAVQIVMGAGGIKHGGPNDTTTNNAFGATCFELWAA